MNLLEEIQKHVPVASFDVDWGNNVFTVTDEQILQMIIPCLQYHKSNDSVSNEVQGSCMRIGGSPSMASPMTSFADNEVIRVSSKWHRYVSVEKPFRDRVQESTHEDSLEFMELHGVIEDGRWKIHIQFSDSENFEITRSMKEFIDRYDLSSREKAAAAKWRWDHINRTSKIGAWERTAERR